MRGAFEMEGMMDEFEEWYKEYYKLWLMVGTMPEPSRHDTKAAWQASVKHRDAQYKAMDRQTREPIEENTYLEGVTKERRRIVGMLREWEDDYEVITGIYCGIVADRIEGE